MFYLIAAMPFTEWSINYTNIYSELIVSMIYFLLPFQGANISSQAKDNLDTFMVTAVYSVFCMHLISPFYIFMRNAREKVVARRRSKVLPAVPTEVEPRDGFHMSLSMKSI
jgi:hypothetical protein